MLMARTHKLLEQILRGDADTNVKFSGMVQLLKRLAFGNALREAIAFFGAMESRKSNLQPHAGKCQPYQVKQVRNVIINYRLAGEADV